MRGRPGPWPGDGGQGRHTRWTRSCQVSAIGSAARAASWTASMSGAAPPRSIRPAGPGCAAGIGDLAVWPGWAGGRPGRRRCRGGGSGSGSGPGRRRSARSSGAGPGPGGGGRAGPASGRLCRRLGARRRSRPRCRTRRDTVALPGPARSASASMISVSGPCSASIWAVAGRCRRLRAAPARWAGGGPRASWVHARVMLERVCDYPAGAADGADQYPGRAACAHPRTARGVRPSRSASSAALQQRDVSRDRNRRSRAAVLATSATGVSARRPSSAEADRSPRPPVRNYRSGCCWARRRRHLPR